MKKDSLHVGLVYLCIGVVFLIIALNFQSRIGSLLFGFAGAGICGGATLLWKYYYWTRQGNKDRYQKKIENMNIELHDERKVMIRDKSGRYAYIIGLIVMAISIIFFSLLSSLDILAESKMIVAYLAGFLAFQYIIGIIIFNRLNKKY